MSWDSPPPPTETPTYQKVTTLGALPGPTENSLNVFNYRLGTSKGESILYKGPPGIWGGGEGGKGLEEGGDGLAILAGENPAASLGSKHRGERLSLADSQTPEAHRK